MTRKIARQKRPMKPAESEPAGVKRSTADEGMGELVALVARLRAEDGCPWDKEQTHRSLKPALLEETYELLEAIEKGDAKELSEELGDLLLQVIFHSQIAAEAGRFTIRNVISSLKDKLVRRHPHVFADRTVTDVDTVLRQRADIKAKERSRSGFPTTSLGELPRAMPALARAQRITERAAALGFDWPRIEPVWEKVAEELAELKSASATGDKQRIREEAGDLMFALVNLCRFLDLQAEEALALASDRFLKRFAHIETRLRGKGKTPTEASLEEMDALWDEAKSLERRKDDG